uniref:Uncharacterized protein n=1 Tax=Romanomermis culicivorax TaxID=13658 RepID=A0A915IR98_ROMCU
MINGLEDFSKVVIEAEIFVTQHYYKILQDYWIIYIRFNDQASAFNFDIFHSEPPISDHSIGCRGQIFNIKVIDSLPVAPYLMFSRGIVLTSSVGYPVVGKLRWEVDMQINKLDDQLCRHLHSIAAPQREGMGAINDRVVTAKYTCDKLPYKDQCATGRSSQFTLRWFVMNGMCCSYPYSYCTDDDDTLTSAAIRTKRACEEICLNKTTDMLRKNLLKKSINA